MGGPSHLALHPFNRVPILTHGDFTLYETAAIVTYIAPDDKVVAAALPRMATALKVLERELADGRSKSYRTDREVARHGR